MLRTYKAMVITHKQCSIIVKVSILDSEYKKNILVFQLCVFFFTNGAVSQKLRLTLYKSEIMFGS